MAQFEILGGKKLKGEISIMGSKNAALPLICASLLTTEECVIKNVPKIEDVKVMIKLLRDIGVEINWLEINTLKIHAKKIKKHKLDPSFTHQLRASVLLMGPMLARLGKMQMIHPGGCYIGTRPVGTHFDALEALGAKISQDKTNYYLEARKLKGASIYLDEQSVTATENTILAAVLAEGKTIIKYAACERHIVSLAEFLNSMGADIKGAGTTTIIINGKKKLHGAKASVIDDEIEVGTFIALALALKSNLTLTAHSFDDIEPILHRAKKMGAKFSIKRVGSKSRLNIKTPETIKPTRIQSCPWPGFPDDLHPTFAVVATQASGVSLVHDWMFERRLFYLDELIKMGANIVICGPAKLYGTHIISPDIRAGIALVIAGLVASGKTQIDNIELIERGYYKIEERLKRIGAMIKRIG
jgi:UDP-N-acetylglucosamine 1-carboxyvinyltransferase